MQPTEVTKTWLLCEDQDQDFLGFINTMEILIAIINKSLEILKPSSSRPRSRTTIQLCILEVFSRTTSQLHCNNKCKQHITSWKPYIMKTFMAPAADLLSRHHMWKSNIMQIVVKLLSFCGNTSGQCYVSFSYFYISSKFFFQFLLLSTSFTALSVCITSSYITDNQMFHFTHIYRMLSCTTIINTIFTLT